MDMVSIMPKVELCHRKVPPHGSATEVYMIRATDWNQMEVPASGFIYLMDTPSSYPCHCTPFFKCDWQLKDPKSFIEGGEYALRICALHISCKFSAHFSVCFSRAETRNKWAGQKHGPKSRAESADQM